MRETTKKKEPLQEEEEEGKKDFPTQYIEVKEDEKEINEKNTLNGWMQR